MIGPKCIKLQTPIFNRGSSSWYRELHLVPVRVPATFQLLLKHSPNKTTLILSWLKSCGWGSLVIHDTVFTRLTQAMDLNKPHTTCAGKCFPTPSRSRTVAKPAQKVNAGRLPGEGRTKHYLTDSQSIMRCGLDGFTHCHVIHWGSI